MQVEDPFRRQNSTPVAFFVLTSYYNPGSLRWLFFCALLLLYLLMVFTNVLLLFVIALNRSLHEPMYIFLCSLFINELYGSAALLPFLMVHVLRDVHTISTPLCFIQIFVIHGYGAIEFLILAGMSYDRFIAICHPLHYKTLMNQKKMALLIFLPWTYAFSVVGVIIGLSSSLELCGNTIDKIYCDNYPVVKLACYDTTINNIFGIVSVFSVIVYPFIVILYTYFCILKVCWRGTELMRKKAMSTCVPHLASVLNFSVAVFFEVLQGRFDMSHIPKMLRILLSLYFLLCQPLFNPLIYGLVLTKIKLICKNLLRSVFKKS